MDRLTRFFNFLPFCFNSFALILTTALTKMDDKRATSAAMAAASDDVSLNLDIPIHDYDLPTSAKVYSIQVILRDTLEKLDIVANLTAPKDTKAAIESVMQALEERQATENDFLQTVQQRSEQGASIRAQQANAATLKETLIAFRGISRKLTQKLSSESATSAQILHAKLRKEKLRLLAILLRTAKELKSTGACPTLFKTVADDKNRESRLENTVKYIAALNENIGKLEKAIAVESEARIKEESNAKIQLQRLKDQLREMKTDLQVAQVRPKPLFCATEFNILIVDDFLGNKHSDLKKRAARHKSIRFVERIRRWNRRCSCAFENCASRASARTRRSRCLRIFCCASRRKPTSSCSFGATNPRPRSKN
jgi:Tfp pilus assembly protein PilO